MKRLRHLIFCVALFATLNASAAHLVFMIGEDEYHTWETLPEFAKTSVEPLGHRVTIIHADADDKNHFPGLIEALRDADLLFVSVRRRTPVKEQLDSIRAFLDSGKPLLGIRTASHAFSRLPKDKDTPLDPELAVWPEFDAQVLGGNYTGYYRDEAKTTLAAAPGAEDHAILAGIPLSAFIGHAKLYNNTPLAATATPLLIGTIPDHPGEPVAWTHRFGPRQARIFYTSLGHTEDFRDAAFRRLLLNAIAWGLEK